MVITEHGNREVLGSKTMGDNFVFSTQCLAYKHKHWHASSFLVELIQNDP